MIFPLPLAIPSQFVYNHDMAERDDETVKKLIASNIAYYRRECHLTQAELAEKIHYSDKSVSKWERAEGVPDVFVLVMLANLFDVTVNDLLSEKHRKSRKAAPKLKRSLITIMSMSLVWLLALIAFFAIKLAAPDYKMAWLSFIIAIPVCFTVGTVLSALWHPLIVQFIMQSGIVWGLAVSLHLAVRIQNMYLIYIIAAGVQFLLILWFLFRRTPVLSVKLKTKINKALKK